MYSIFQIIHIKWILTAAHCINTIVKVEVFLGAINRYANGSLGSFLKSIIVTNKRSIIYHPEYNTNTRWNDIGLLELPEDAPIGAYIGLASIPKGSDTTRDLTGLQGIVSGYGETSFSSL